MYTDSADDIELAPRVMPVVRVSQKSDPTLIRHSIQQILTELEPVDLLEEESGVFELVLAEVINNVVEHAYAEDPNGRIDILAVPGPRGISCRISDSGKPMPGGKPPVGMLHDLDCDTQDLPEGGFGWFLIGDLAKDLRYERRDGQNHLSFRMAIGGF
jgi:serine/threonine-protein kinase RsbW